MCKSTSMKTNFKIFIGLALIASAISCVSQKKFNTQVSLVESLNNQYAKKQDDLNACEAEKTSHLKQIDDLSRQISDLNKEKEFLKANNTLALNQLEALSVISSSQAESIKKSMDNLGVKDAYIQSLQTTLARKDSLNLALVMNLKGAIGNLEDKDINIKVEKGVVFIDISDKLLFKSGSYTITEQAEIVLGKVAKVLQAQSDLEFMVEGHTDNVPYKTR